MADVEKLVKKGNLATKYWDQLIEVDITGLQKDNEQATDTGIDGFMLTRSLSTFCSKKSKSPLKHA